jgi:hypothetical protein
MVSHQRWTPAEIWSASLSSQLRVPRVCTSSISSTLAEVIGALELNFPTNNTIKYRSSKSTTSSSESSVSQASDNDEEMDNRMSAIADCCINVPNEDKFPLLHSIFSTQKGHNLLDRLINEVVRFTESSEINFKRGNNSTGTLIVIPSLRNLDR